MLTPELKAWLHSVPERRSVVLFGIEAHVCILQTAIELINNGYDVTILADATSSQRHNDRKLALEQLRAWGASVLPSESVLFALMESADHGKFSQISALVKGTICRGHDDL